MTFNMITLLRKLRLKFIRENKIRNYLLYALGEIILVVAGILIALAINNAQEDRLLERKELTYLSGLENEFEISKSKLQELIKVNKASYEKAAIILNYTSSLKDTMDEREFSNLLNDAFSRDISFNPNISLIQEMISSGSLKDLSDKDLRIQLTNWLASLEDIAGQERSQEARRQEVMKIFESEKASVRTIVDHSGITERILELQPLKEHYSNLHLLQSRSFENNLLLFILSAKSTESNHYLPLTSDLNQILESIRTNLEKHK